MISLGVLSAVAASFGWAAGMVLAHGPSRALNALEFTRIQLLVAGVVTGLVASALGLWPSIDWAEWPAFLVSILVGVILGNLAMVACLRHGGPRNTELVISLKAPLIAAMAYLWFGERLGMSDLTGAAIVLSGVALAIGASHPEAREGPGGLTLFFGFVAAACQGIGFLALKPALAAGAEPIALGAIRLVGASLIVSLIALWPAAAPAGRKADALTPLLLFRTVLPGLIGYSVSTPLLFYAFAHSKAGIAAVLGSLSPILILPIVWVVEGRRPPALAFAGAALAVAGGAVIVIW